MKKHRQSDADQAPAAAAPFVAVHAVRVSVVRIVSRRRGGCREIFAYGESGQLLETTRQGSR